VLVDADGRSTTIDPELHRSAAVGLIDLMGVRWSEAAVDSRGELRISFENGRSLVAASVPRYEAWVINGPGGLLVVCMPGGELAVWSPS